MRENRPSGSEGGAGVIPLSLPLSYPGGPRRRSRTSRQRLGLRVVLYRFATAAGGCSTRALGSAQMEEGESPSLVELNTSNGRSLRHHEVRWRATGSERIVRRLRNPMAIPNTNSIRLDTTDETASSVRNPKNRR